MESQKLQNCQNNPEDQEQSWRHNPPRLQTILQNFSNQKSMGFPARKTQRDQVDV